MSESNPDLPATEEQTADTIESSATGETAPMDLNAIDEDHAFAQYAGHKNTIKQKVADDALGEFLADMIYDSNSAFVREFLQNAETACIRAAKCLLRQHPDYGTEWLNREMWVRSDTGELVARGKDEQSVLADFDIATDAVRHISLPRAIEDVLEAAKNIGYEPQIEVELRRDDRQVIIEDNGIGMTMEEIDKAYNTVLNSGVRGDEDTGGKYGIGSLTYANLTGLDGKMIAETWTRLPESDPKFNDYDKTPTKFSAYLGGIDGIPGDEYKLDGKGTRFEIPVQDEVDLGRFSGWVEDYASGLRIPVLYTKEAGGMNLENEEYGGESFLERFGDSPVQIHRPGEFTALAGPDIEVGYRDPDTWLVSMEIDRNTYVTVESFWDVVVQIHDEQGRIIAGPHRGMHADDLDELHEDDIPTPQPTGDRDRLKDNDNSKRFWRYLASEVEEYELAQVSEIAEAMQEADHPADAIRDESEDWVLLKQMVDYHGGRNVTSTHSGFDEFLDEYDAFPDYDEETSKQVYRLFKEVGWAEQGSRNPNLKGGRTQTKLGDILSSVPPENVYMGVSISKDLCKIVYNTHDNAAVIGVSKASDYSDYEEAFGFTKLKTIPRTQSDDHEFDVPDDIHARNNQPALTSDDDSDSKPEDVADRNLKIRCKNTNNSIDKRMTVNRFREYMENDSSFDGKKYVIAFPRGADYENISDHYGMQKYAALVSVTQAEYGAINEFDRVFTLEAFKEFSKTTPVRTDNGEMELSELFEGDSFPLLIHEKKDRHNYLDTENEAEAQRLRNLIIKDAISSPYYGDAGKPDLDDVIYASVSRDEWQRLAYALNKQHVTSDRNVPALIVRFSYNSPSIFCRIKEVKVGDMSTKTFKAETPAWNNDSDVYRWWSRVSSSTYKPMRGILMGFHDNGLDPTEFSRESLRNMSSEMNPGGNDWWDFTQSVANSNLEW